MDPETIELTAVAGALPTSRVRIGVKTSAKGEVYAEFTIEVETPTGDNGDLMHHLDVLEGDVIARVARIKATYERALTEGAPAEVEV